MQTLSGETGQVWRQRPCVQLEMAFTSTRVLKSVCVCSVPQVSGDHQHPGRPDLCSGPSQPGQEAVGPGCFLGWPGVVQPQQT